MKSIWKFLKNLSLNKGSDDTYMLEKEFGLSDRISHPIPMGCNPMWMKF